MIAVEYEGMIRGIESKCFDKVLRRGSRGPCVRWLQELLFTISHFRVAVPDATPERDIDGIFGPRTERAVKFFQDDQGIKVDGVVGPETWGALIDFMLRAGYEIPEPPDKKEKLPISVPARLEISPLQKYLPYALIGLGIIILAFVLIKKEKE